MSSVFMSGAVGTLAEDYKGHIEKGRHNVSIMLF